MEPSGVRPRPVAKPPNIKRILPPIATITASDEATLKSPVDPSISNGSGISAAWKGGALSSSPASKSNGKSFEEKSRDKSIGVGTEHAMSLLGELHKNENLSNSWKWERASKNDASSEAIPPIFQEQAVPSCPKPRTWSNLEAVPCSPRHHHDKIPTRASPGKAANGRDGRRHHDKKTIRASPGKAVNIRDRSCRHHDNISNACPGEASNGKGISDHRVGRHYDNPPNASPGKASNGRRFRDHSHREGC